MTLEQWLEGVPSEICGDALWKMEAYRLGLFLSDLAWIDATKLLKDSRTRGIADQLFRACGNISSNIAEGYSRGTGKDRSRFYEYALGSARETRDWYFKGRKVLSDKVVAHRLDVSTQLIKLLVKMSSNERRENTRIIISKPVVPSSRTNHQSPTNV